MPLKLETSGVSFEVGKAVDSKSDRDTGHQRMERIGRPRGLVQLIVHDEPTGSEIITVTVAGEQPKVTVKQPHCPPCCAGLDGYSESMTARRGDLRGPVTKPVPTAVIRQRPR
jgi:hypothetical protein